MVINRRLLISIISILLFWGKLVYKKLYHHLGLEQQAKDFTSKYVKQVFEARGGNVEFYHNLVMNTSENKINFTSYISDVTKVLEKHYTEAEAQKILTDNDIPLNSSFSLDKRVTRYEPKFEATKDIYEAAKKFGASLVHRIEKVMDNNLVEINGDYSHFTGIKDEFFKHSSIRVLSKNSEEITLHFTPRENWGTYQFINPPTNGQISEIRYFYFNKEQHELRDVHNNDLILIFSTETVNRKWTRYYWSNTKEGYSDSKREAFRNNYSCFNQISSELNHDKLTDCPDNFSIHDKNHNRFKRYKYIITKDAGIFEIINARNLFNYKTGLLERYALVTMKVCLNQKETVVLEFHINPALKKKDI